MMIDDWKAGKLPPDDPWAVEALKRGLIQPRMNPYTNPDTSPKETRGFQPDPMAQTVRELPGKLLTNADENLTKNITALTPKPPESQYGSIRMPRMSDNPENAGNFVMAGPIAVEQALSKIAAKVLPAKTIQDKLLQAGASKAELETRGVTQFLESKGGRPIFPKEVAKHLEENPYQLKEVVKTDTPHVFPPKHVQEQFTHDFDAAKTIVSNLEHNDPRYPEAVKRFKDAEAAMRHNVPGWGIAEGGGESKFSSYQTPGGENYREILMTDQKASQKLTTVQHPSGKGYAVLKSDGSYLVAGPDTVAPGTPLMWDTATAADKYGIPFHRDGFNSSHWDEPNVLAHMRVNDRTLPSGEKALHVEEWQSDWANKLREVKAAGGGGGYSVEQMSEHGKGTDWFVYNRLGEEVAGPFKTPGEGNQWVKKVGPDMPSHPLVDNWQDLMARRTLKEAVDGGYDRLTWTTGQQQADRYDLSKQIDKIQYEPIRDPAGKYELIVYGKNNTQLIHEDEIGLDRIAELVGKDMARKIGAKEGTAQGGSYRDWYELSGLDLKVGGEWAKKLYDESMVNRFNKIGKKYGVQAEDLDIAQGTKHPETYAHSLKITPEMRQSIGAAKFHPFADLPGPAEKVATELWHGIHYPKTFKGFKLEGDPQKWGAVQYSQIDKGSNAAPITFYVKPGQDLETRLAEVMAKFGGKK